MTRRLANGRVAVRARGASRLPWAYRALTEGDAGWSLDRGRALAAAYFEAGGHLLQACASVGVPYAAVQQWRRDEPACQALLDEVEALVREAVHGQFLQKVLDPAVRMPAWTAMYFRKHFPDYVGAPTGPAVTIRLVDSTIRPTPIEATVVRSLTDGAGPPEESPYVG